MVVDNQVDCCKISKINTVVVENGICSEVSFSFALESDLKSHFQFRGLLSVSFS